MCATGQLESILPLIPGLAELKTMIEMKEKFGECLSQVLAEHLAAIATGAAAGNTRPLDQRSLQLCGRQLHTGTDVIEAIQINSASHAAALMEHILAQRCDTPTGTIGLHRDRFRPRR